MYICLKGCIESIATLMLYNSQPWNLEGIASCKYWLLTYQGQPAPANLDWTLLMSRALTVECCRLIPQLVALLSASHILNLRTIQPTQRCLTAAFQAQEEQAKTCTLGYLVSERALRHFHLILLVTKPISLGGEMGHVSLVKGSTKSCGKRCRCRCGKESGPSLPSTTRSG